jgi:DNA (cytosine-5)-methyltransferase 1
VVIPASAAAVLATASNRTWSAATATYLGDLYDQPTPAAATA